MPLQGIIERRLRRSSVYLGGSLQLHFGIWGPRWWVDDDNDDNDNDNDGHGHGHDRSSYRNGRRRRRPVRVAPTANRQIGLAFRGNGAWVWPSESEAGRLHAKLSPQPGYAQTGKPGGRGGGGTSKSATAATAATAAATMDNGAGAGTAATMAIGGESMVALLKLWLDAPPPPSTIRSEAPSPPPPFFNLVFPIPTDLTAPTEAASADLASQFEELCGAQLATAAAQTKRDKSSARERWGVGDCAADLERQMLQWWQEQERARAKSQGA